MDSSVVVMLVNDTRLSPEARSIALYVLCKGDGAHEISHRELARVLQNPGEKKLRAAIQDAVDLSLDRTAGGRGSMRANSRATRSATTHFSEQVLTNIRYFWRLS